MVALPADNISQFTNRPKKLEKSEFEAKKEMLKIYCMKLRKTGKELEAENILVMDIKGFSGWRKRRTFYRRLRVYETQAMKAEQEYEDLETASNYAQNYDMLAFT